MFTFGIFSTHIPYLVFFLFYLTYFLFSTKSVEKKELIEEFLFGKKELVVEYEQIDKLEDCYFSQSENEDEVFNTFNADYHPISNELVLGPGDRIVIAHFHEQSGLISNRPPPAYC